MLQRRFKNLKCVFGLDQWFLIEAIPSVVGFGNLGVVFGCCSNWGELGAYGRG